MKWILCVIFLILLTQPAAAKIYKVVDEYGRITFTDTPPTNNAEEYKVGNTNIIDEGSSHLVSEPYKVIDGLKVVAGTLNGYPAWFHFEDENYVVIQNTLAEKAGMGALTALIDQQIVIRARVGYVPAIKNIVEEMVVAGVKMHRVEAGLDSSTTVPSEIIHLGRSFWQGYKISYDDNRQLLFLDTADGKPVPGTELVKMTSAGLNDNRSPAGSGKQLRIESFDISQKKRESVTGKKVVSAMAPGIGSMRGLIGLSNATVVLTNTGNFTLELIKCSVEYRTPVPKSNGHSPIIMGAEVEDGMIIRTAVGYAHPMYPTNEQINQSLSSKYGRRTSNILSLPSSERGLVNSVLPSQKSQCRFTLNASEISEASLTVEWMKQGETSFSGSSWSSWNP